MEEGIKEFFAEDLQTSGGKKTGIYGHSGEYDI